MNSTEIEFTKYRQCGAYHWQDVSGHPMKRNAFVISRYKNVLSLLKEALGGSLKKKIILDVGCGDGVLSCWMAKEGAEVSGVDYSDIAIDCAKKKAGKLRVSFRQADAYKLPFPDNYFDGAVSSDVLEHLSVVGDCLKEVKRVLKINGVLVTSTPIRFTEKPLDTLHVTEWFQSEFRELITRVFPRSEFYESHPLFWMELYKRSPYGRCVVNLVSFFKNPFKGFKKGKWKMMVMQYSVSTKIEC